MNETKLWQAIYKLYAMLISRVNDEAAYQTYFECNPIVFHTLGFDAFASFEKSSGNLLPFDVDRGYRPEPDFLCARTGAGEITVFELKTPFVGDLIVSRSSDGNRTKLRAQAEGYVSQTTEYAESIQGRTEARAVVQKALGVDRIAAYRVALVYGLAEDNKIADVTRLLANRTGIPIEIMFYDTLLNRLSDAYAMGRKDVFSRMGWCFVYHLVFPDHQPYARAYLGDFGGHNSDRLSIYLEGTLLVFESIDSGGRTHRLTGNLAGKEPHYIRFEFSNDIDGIYMSLNIDNQEHDLRVGQVQLQFDPNFSTYTLGADIDGANGAAFQILENYAVNRTLTMQEKLDSFHYFSENAPTQSSCIEFRPQSFMKRSPDGHLVQEVEALKPTMQNVGY